MPFPVWLMSPSSTTDYTGDTPSTHLLLHHHFHTGSTSVCMHVCVCVRPIITSGKFTPSVRQYLIGCQLPANGLQSAAATRWLSSPLALSISSVCLFFKLGVCLTPLWLLRYGWKMAFHAWNEVSFKSQSSVKFYFMDLTPTVNSKHQQQKQS